MLYIENTKGGDISVVDLRTYKEVYRIPLVEGAYPDDIVGSSDGKFLYLNGLLHIKGHPAPDATYDNTKLIAVSPETRKVVWEQEVRGQLGHIAISPDDRYLYAAIFDMYYLLRFDLTTREAKYIPVHFVGGHGIRISEDGKRVYLGSILFAEMDIIDTEAETVIQRVFFRDPVRPFEITRNGNTAYVQTSWMHGFHVVDLKQNHTTKTIALPTLGVEVPVALAWPNTVDHGMILTPDEKRLISVATTGGYVSIYSVPDLDLIGSVPVGAEPSWAITDRTGNIAYVSNRKSDTITVVSIPEAKALHTIKVGVYPQRMWIVD